MKGRVWLRKCAPAFHIMQSLHFLLTRVSPFSAGPDILSTKVIAQEKMAANGKRTISSEYEFQPSFFKFGEVILKQQVKPHGEDP